MTDCRSARLCKRIGDAPEIDNRKAQKMGSVESRARNPGRPRTDDTRLMKADAETLNVTKPRPPGTNAGSGESTRVAFRFHARALAALGRDLVTNDVVAVMELVKNAYDALATRVDVRIRTADGASDERFIEIVDDGHGMDYATIRDVWFMIATPFRQKRPVLKMGARSRAVTGEKGLGRLSAARLGSDLRVVTRTAGGPVLQFALNWEELLRGDDLTAAGFDVSGLPPEAFDGEHGTRIRIGGLASNWNKDKIEDLRQNLSRLVSPFAGAEDFSLHLDVTDDGSETDVQHIESLQFMSEPKYAMEGNVDGDGTIRSRYRYRPITGSGGREREVREPWSAVYKSLPQSDRAGVDEGKPGCGPFAFEIRAWDLTKDDTRDIEAHFGETSRHVRGAIASQRGVSVYRDDVLALPKSDGARDWLGLDLRRVSRVGDRLSTSQVVGYVRISKAGNPRIVDTSDREGLVSNPATVAFRHLVTRVVTLLEVERHKDRTAAKDTGTARELFADLSAEALVAKLEELRDSGAGMADAVDAATAFGSALARSRAVIEKRFGYYNRLAVIGTIAQLVIHEIRTRTTVIGRGLRKAGALAERLRDGVATQAVDMATGSVAALEALADRFAPLGNRGYRPGRRTSVVEESVSRCLAMLKQEIRSGGVTVDADFGTRTAVRIDPVEIDTILLNLITNSLYWMRRHDGERRLRFSLAAGPGKDRVTVSLDDSGPGIDPEERDRVFWPGVTHKPDGIGMGLTVASELVDGRGGKMRTVVPGALGGGTFEFDLPLVGKPAAEERS